jgi:hypothetical protein
MVSKLKFIKLTTMTNHTDSSKEIEDILLKEIHGGSCSVPKWEKIQKAAAAILHHLHPSPSPGGWIDVKDRTPDAIEGKDYSENVFVICDGKLEVMSYGWVDAEPEGGWVWSNCYGDINGEGEWDDDYKPTHWMPLPSLPTSGGQRD